MQQAGNLDRLMLNIRDKFNKYGMREEMIVK